MGRFVHGGPLDPRVLPDRDPLGRAPGLRRSPSPRLRGPRRSTAVSIVPRPALADRQVRGPGDGREFSRFDAKSAADPRHCRCVCLLRHEFPGCWPRPPGTPQPWAASSVGARSMASTSLQSHQRRALVVLMVATGPGLGCSPGQWGSIAFLSRFLIACLGGPRHQQPRRAAQRRHLRLPHLPFWPS